MGAGGQHFIRGTGDRKRFGEERPPCRPRQRGVGKERPPGSSWVVDRAALRPEGEACREEAWGREWSVLL